MEIEKVRTYSVKCPFCGKEFGFRSDQLTDSQKELKYFDCPECLRAVSIDLLTNKVATAVIKIAKAIAGRG